MLLEKLKKCGITLNDEAKKIIDKIYLTKAMEEKFLLTIKEHKNFHNEDINKILNNIKFEDKASKKENGLQIIKEFEKVKKPIYFEVMDSFNEEIKKIKHKNVQIKYPKDFEGESIEIKINVRDYKEFLEIMNFIKNKENEFEKIFNLFSDEI